MRDWVGGGGNIKYYDPDQPADKGANHSWGKPRWALGLCWHDMSELIG